MKESIASSGGMSAEARFAQPQERKPAPTPKMERILDEAELNEPARRPQRRPKPKPATADAAPPAPGFSRTKLLLALNCIALLTCAIMMQPLLTLGETPRALALPDFPEVGPIVELQARPPALYAIVNGKTWNAFDEKQKRHFVDGMGSVLLTEGYWGLTVKTQDGRLVADWLEHGGAHLLNSQDDTSAVDGETHAPAQAKAPAAAGQYSRFVP
jgi:hypothetical protein